MYIIARYKGEFIKKTRIIKKGNGLFRYLLFKHNAFYCGYLRLGYAAVNQKSLYTEL